MNDLFDSQLYFPDFENVTFLEVVALAGQRLYDQPKRLADLWKLVDKKVELLLTEFIFILELIYIDHDGRDQFFELRVVGQEGLVLFSELDDSDFFEYDVDYLGVELGIGEIEIEEVVMGLFPALDDKTPKVLNEMNTILFPPVVWLFCLVYFQ